MTDKPPTWYTIDEMHDWLKDAIHTGGIDELNSPQEETFIEIALPVRFSLDGKRHYE